LSRFKWNILPPVPEDKLPRKTDIPSLVVQLLYNRGITEPAGYESFLNIDERLSGDPFLLPDMHQAVGRIYRALLSGEKIVVYGDFDCDGITSTVALVEGLTALGGNVIPYIPHRITEGYGLKSAALDKLREEGASLIVTCDCGITAIPEVKRAKRARLDIVITDHHLPTEELPPAIASVNPKRSDSRYPFAELAGVGVAFKLLQALYTSLGKLPELEKLYDLAAVGTIADMVPLIGENRLLVKQGLAKLNKSPRLGIKEMLERANVSGEVTTERVSWVLAPRLNTPGRLEHAMASYRLLTTSSTEEARELTLWLEQKNTERQRLTSSAQVKAREQVIAGGLTSLLFAGDAEFPIGLNGLVANRLAEEFYRPAIVFRTGETWSTGSARSIPEFDIISALNRCRELLSHFGGHTQAAGLTLLTGNLPAFKTALLEIADTQLAGVDLRPHIDIDAVAALSELVKNDTYQIIQRMAPFGQGNPVPIFLCRNVNVVECRTMGNGDHLRMKLKQNSSVWDAVGFGLGDCIKDIVSPMDIVYNLELDHWNGRDTLRLNVLDMSPIKPANQSSAV